MSFIGRFQLGDFVPVELWCTTLLEAIVQPDAAPTFQVVSAAGVTSATGKIPLAKRPETNQFFYTEIPLGTAFAVGFYTIVIRYVVNTLEQAELRQFEVVPGGAASGVPIAATTFQGRNGSYVVVQTNAGQLMTFRNPRIPG